jgi:hypothetical protein
MIYRVGMRYTVLPLPQVQPACELYFDRQYILAGQEVVVKSRSRKRYIRERSYENIFQLYRHYTPHPLTGQLCKFYTRPGVAYFGID